MKTKLLFIALFLSTLFTTSSFTSETTPTTTKVDKIDFLVVIATEYGKIRLVLFRDTPIHRSNFLQLVGEKKYDGTNFHRVIENFMIQGGQLAKENLPKGWDTLSFHDQTLTAEIRDRHTHNYGALCAARTDNPNMRSDISQFYIVQNKEGAHYLDGKYTVFGQVMSGFDVLDKIAKTAVANEAPIKKINMTIQAYKVKESDLQKFYGYKQSY